MLKREIPATRGINAASNERAEQIYLIRQAQGKYLVQVSNWCRNGEDIKRYILCASTCQIKTEDTDRYGGR